MADSEAGGSESASVDERLRGLLERADEMQVFSEVAMEIQRVTQDPESSLMDLEGAVSMDPTLAARLLKVANSPFYGLKREVKTLGQALFVIGFDATRSMSLGMSLVAAGQKERKERRQLWAHSMRSGAIAQQLARQSQLMDHNEALVGGMLHDIGRLLMLQTAGYRYRPILVNQEMTPMERVQAEFDLFEFDHSMLGAACLERWRIPNSVCVAVAKHHDLASAADASKDVQIATCVVHIADELEHASSDSLEQVIERVQSLPLVQETALKNVNFAETLEAANQATEVFSLS